MNRAKGISLLVQRGMLYRKRRGSRKWKQKARKRGGREKENVVIHEYSENMQGPRNL